MKLNSLLTNKKEYDDIEFGKQFVTPLCLGGVIFSFVAIFINTQLDFGIISKLIPYVGFVIFGFLYYMAYKGKYLIFVKWFLVSAALLFVNILWYYNFGSQGPVLYFFVLIYSYLIFLLERKQLFFTSLILVLNVAILYYIDNRFPSLTGHYPSIGARIEDVYTGIFLYFFLIFIVMRGAKNIYITQYKKAKKADQLKSSFLANMSHEIRTPLNAIVGFSNILADENLTVEEKKQYIEIINGSNDSLLRLVNDILDVSMIESDQLSLVTTRCDVGNLMDNLKETYLLKLNESHTIRLINKKMPGHVLVKTDSARLQQVMINLLDNAVKYTEKGEIEFGFSVEDKYLKFYVKDTGIGIKDYHLNYLFDRFYKVEDDNTKLFRGTGIGLYLSKRIVGMLGGEIWIESEYGKGSMFYFTIPKTDFQIEMNENEPDLGNHENLLTNIENRVKILIIDDQESNQQYYTALLKPGNFELVQAFSGMEGIEAFEKHPDIGLILLDLKMPDIDGFEVLKEIRKKSTGIPIIAQTAYAMAADKEKCLEAGFNDYIAKPVQREALVSLIAKYLPHKNLSS